MQQLSFARQDSCDKYIPRNVFNRKIDLLLFTKVGIDFVCNPRMIWIHHCTSTSVKCGSQTGKNILLKRLPVKNLFGFSPSRHIVNSSALLSSNFWVTSAGYIDLNQEENLLTVLGNHLQHNSHQCCKSVSPQNFICIPIRHIRKCRLPPHHLTHSLPQGTISWLLSCNHSRRKYRGEQLSAACKMPPVSPQLSLSFYLADSFSVELHELLHCWQCVDLWPLPDFFRQTVLNVPQGSSQHHGHQW